MRKRESRLRILELERQFLEAYERISDNEPALSDWVRVAAWPEK